MLDMLFYSEVEPRAVCYPIGIVGGICIAPGV